MLTDSFLAYSLLSLPLDNFKCCWPEKRPYNTNILSRLACGNSTPVKAHSVPRTARSLWSHFQHLDLPHPTSFLFLYFITFNCIIHFLPLPFLPSLSSSFLPLFPPTLCCVSSSLLCGLLFLSRQIHVCLS